MTNRKPRWTGVWVAVAAGLTLALTVLGGWGLDLRARGGVTTAVGEHPQRGGASGQRAGQPRPTREQDPLPPRWPWWKDEAFQKEIGLTASQSERIDSVYRQRETELAPYIEEWRTQRDELNRMARERTVTVEAFAIQAGRVDALWVRLDESRMVMLYRMSRELNDAQYQKLQEVRERRARGGGRGGSGR